MKKENLFLMVLSVKFIFLGQIYAQLQFTPYTIDSTKKYISTHVIDLDADGDIDVLATAKFGDGIHWFENDGSQHFSRLHIPHPKYNAGDIVYATDLDSDGDLDILSYGGGSTADMEWFENDGNENFTQHYFMTKTTGATSIFAVDIDNDEDMDVLASTEFYDPWLTDRTISWYENDGNENFSRHIITNDVYNARSIFAIDLDNDGDIDVLSADWLDLSWYENDGNENFSTHVIADKHAYSVYAVDLDKDEDIDIISGASEEIAWHENDSYQNFTKHIITTEAVNVLSVFAIDIDDEGDFDILAASSVDGKIAWYENNNTQDFLPHIITNEANGVFFVHAVDVDNDSDIDLFSASDVYPDNGSIAWYENLMVVGIKNENQGNFLKDFRLHQNYPNPFNNSTIIKYKLSKASDVDLSIYNLLGQKLVTLVSENQLAGRYNVQWDATGFASSVYVYKLETNTGFIQIRKLVLLK